MVETATIPPPLPGSTPTTPTRIFPPVMPTPVSHARYCLWKVLRTSVLIETTDQAENFAEHVILATYDNVVPGGLAGIPAPTPNHLAVQNQYTNVKNLLGNKIRKVTGATCNRQPTPLIGITSPVVCMGPDALAQGACVGTPNMKRDENGHDALIAAAEKEPGIYEPASRWTESA